MAVATPKGLMTPVVGNAETLSMIEFEWKIAVLGKKAHNGKLMLEDMSGGIFTMCICACDMGYCKGPEADLLVAAQMVVSSEVCM